MTDTYEFLKAQKDAILAKKEAEDAAFLTAAAEDIAYYRKQVDTLKSENVRLEADAARYRWLREQSSHRTSNPDEDELIRTICVDSWKGSLGKQISGEECDAAIDAARGEG